MQTVTLTPAQQSRDTTASLFSYFALTFLLAWSLWLVAATLGARPLYFLPGTFAPGLVALLFAAHRGGSAAVRHLLSGLFRWRVSAKWYVFAIAYLTIAKLLAAVVHRVMEGSWPAFGQTPFIVLLGGVLISTPFQAGEEVGWRAYALPRLGRRMGMPWASVVLGVIWACWHIPLFYIAGTDSFGQPFTVYLVSVTAVSVVLAWLYVRTGGSLLLVMVMHSAFNNTGSVVPARTANAADPLALSAAPIAWYTAALLAIAAAFFLTRLRHAKLAS
ncbi:MAG TPA: type II CAAX endopeptidase family protein [Longimicrobiales bacterium]|nr:type II CAAX endopeptidase family protein [Longimicrobiales bacterium]